MSLGKSSLVLLAAVLIAGASLFVGYTIGRGHAPASQAEAGGKEDDAKVEVMPKVKTAEAKQATINRYVTAYGTVIASPEDISNISVPFEARVKRVLVTVGQAVSPQTVLIEVEPSPEAALSLSDALSTRDAAARDLAQVQQRLDLKLATKSEMLTAQQALHMAESKLESLQKRGIAPKSLTANISGLVSKIDAQEGQILAAGAPLVETVPADRVQVRLGVEPADAGEVKPGQAVEIVAVQGQTAENVTGQVKILTQRVNPTSRLIDVYVNLPTNDPLLLETYVRGRIAVESKKALVVPREAVQREEEKSLVFTVKDGKAAEHEVETGLDDGRNVELTGGDVKAGDVVVVQGAHELEPEMAVETETERTETQP